ncbi:uncharacterized protein H6S33_005406 [Morchella sextelata]|uniref:uncharacterized protein n=1 Tax=Morchella sextelata TaxID=1174677 RepID=UPI001D056501|nr:uncharacterized protein H6S33_005406 [Morchella sextelata]KAH0613520.1 hypothetical protein H6S33_005406 [Morchella sextelata]
METYASNIDTNKVYPLTKPSSHITPFPSSFNPLSESTPLTPGPWTAHFPNIVAINQPFRLRIECNHEDIKYCPPNYNIQLYGPTAASVPITALSKVNSRTVEAAMVLHEQGEYQVYAWPNYPNCTELQGDPDAAKLYKQSVGGTPHLLIAQRGPFPIGRDKYDVHRACKSYEEVLDGRWINHDLVESSMRTTYSYGEFHPSQVSIAENSLPDSADHSRYVYSPYDCKIPHRSFADVLDEAPALSHVVFIGGSVARGYVCARAFPDLFGNDEGTGVCEQHPEMPLLEHGNRAATRTYSSFQGRKVDVTFAFVGARFSDAVKRLDKLKTPQAVVFDVGNFAGSMPDDEFLEHHKTAFAYFDTRWKGAHVLVRSAASVVQPLQCFGEEGHTRATSWAKRGLTLAAVKQWAAQIKAERAAKMDDMELEEAASTRVSFIDAYTITDPRPETSMDGYHWMYPAPRMEKGFLEWNLTVRPTVGEAEDMLLDWMWDEIVMRRSMASL